MKVARDGERVEADMVYVMPKEVFLLMKGGRLH